MAFSQPEAWNMDEAPFPYPSASAASMSAAPPAAAYQYPLPPANAYSEYPDLVPLPTSIKPGSPLRNRAVPALAIKTGKMKRSISTPNVRGQALSDAASAAEKRRNKLGYHRTSVACGHCRRRKIRCIPAPGDREGRCTNCIRLKKECHFYPVEQEPPHHETFRTDSRAQSSGNPSNLPSPTTPSGQLQDMQASVLYAQGSMPTVQELGEPQIKDDRRGSHATDGSSASTTSARVFDYDGHAHMNWMAPKGMPIQRMHVDMPEYLGMHTQESPITPGFSPFTPNMPHHAMAWSAHPDAGRPDEAAAFSIPQRSISYSNLEGLQGLQTFSPMAPAPAPAPPSFSEQLNGKAPVGPGSSYPPPISTAAGLLSADAHSASTTSTSQPSSTMSGSISSASSFGSWPTPYGYPKTLGSATDSYAPWTSPTAVPAQLADVGIGLSSEYVCGEPGGPMYYDTPGKREAGC